MAKITVDGIMRRRKTAFIPTSFILYLMGGNWRFSKFVSLPSPIGLPKDCRAVALHQDFSRDGIIVVLESESFEPIPEGMVLPWIDTNGLSWESIDLEAKHVT